MWFLSRMLIVCCCIFILSGGCKKKVLGELGDGTNKPDTTIMYRVLLRYDSYGNITHKFVSKGIKAFDLSVRFPNNLCEEYGCETYETRAGSIVVEVAGKKGLSDEAVISILGNYGERINTTFKHDYKTKRVVDKKEENNYEE